VYPLQGAGAGGHGETYKTTTAWGQPTTLRALS